MSVTRCGAPYKRGVPIGFCGCYCPSCCPPDYCNNPKVTYFVRTTCCPSIGDRLYAHIFNLNADCLDCFECLTFPLDRMDGIWQGSYGSPCSSSSSSSTLSCGSCSNIPNTLFATATATFNCPCATGISISLNYNEMTAKWTGSGTMGTCGRNINLSFYCSGGNFLLDSSADGCTGGGTGTSAISTVCSPLSVLFPGVIFSAGCGCEPPGGGGITFTITA
jgi:hypothetical protein